MHYTLLVRIIEGAGDVMDIALCLSQRQAFALANIGREIMPRDELHHHKIGSVDLPKVVDLNDIRVAQRSDGLCLTLEAGAEVSFPCEARRQHFDRNGAPQCG